MKIVAANYADSLRRSGEWETAETAVLDSVRDELRSFYGEAEDALPLGLAALAEQLDGGQPMRIDHNGA